MSICIGAHRLKNVTDANLERAFLRLAVQRSGYLKTDILPANQTLNELQRLRNRMRFLPDLGGAILKRIAKYPDPEVQIIACTALLAVDELFALAALGRIAETAPKSTAIVAARTLREWRAGYLTEHRQSR